ncbi:1-phosphatidylinositol 3-phosphate 5-kinase [Quillaja saponaria]|uniref:1-phosphatidylinositol 3-phosphate 5-kinase n=1 Tax=Quillaja saponaria TaxID=32244 RepID=A0AAD7LK13_QUISA|nr:1-phosphatidylinositol 3-phosphate 5-kinase [Quillaja saponaria]
MESEKRVLRKRNPLSDCTNTNTRTSSQSSSSIPSVVKPPKSTLAAKYKFDGNAGSSKDFRNIENASNPSSVQPPLNFTPSHLEKKSSVSDSHDCKPEPGSVYTRRKTSNRRAVQLPASSEPVKSSSIHDTHDDGSIEPHSVYTRRQTSNCSSLKLHLAFTLPRPAKSSSSTRNLEVFEPSSVDTRSLIFDKRKSKGKAIADPFISTPSVKILNSGDKSIESEGIRQRKAFTVPCRKKQRHMPSEHALPRDFIEKQRAYFAEVDAFELPEEEVASDEELE